MSRPVWAGSHVVPTASAPAEHSIDGELPGSRALEHVSRMACVAVVVAVGVLGSLLRTGLYADGAHLLLGVVTGGGFSVGNPERVFVTVITQAPVVAAIHLGVTGLAALAVIYSAGQVLVPALVWACALWLHRRSDVFWVFALMWACVVPVTAFFAVGEYNLTYALVALVASILLRPAPPGTGALAVLVLASVVLLRSYESMVFLGPVLVALFVVTSRAGRSETSLATQAVRLVIVALLVLGVVAALWSTWRELTAPGSGSDASIGTGLTPSRLVRDPRLVLSAVAAASVALGTVVRGRRAARAVQAGGVAAALSVFLLPFVPVLQPVLPAALDGEWPPPWMAYQARIAVGLVLLVLLVLAWWAWSRSSRSLPTGRAPRAWSRRPLWIVPTLLVLAMGAGYGWETLRFGGWLQDYGQVVRSHSGPVAFESAGIGPRYAWDWTNPSLSLLLWDAPDQGVVLNRASYTGWQPFDPHGALPTVPRRLLGSGD